MLERSPIIAVLLEDGLKRYHQLYPNLDLKLIQTDAIDYFQQLTIQPDVIYCDPIYPERKKSALGKQKLRMIKDIVGEDLDADLLLKTALHTAKHRVVVKRPKLAKPLLRKADFSYYGKNTRFDVYTALI